MKHARTLSFVVTCEYIWFCSHMLLQIIFMYFAAIHDSVSNTPCCHFLLTGLVHSYNLFVSGTEADIDIFICN